MNTLNRSTPVVAAGALLLAVSLGACSAGDGTESSPDTTASSSSAVEALESQLAALGLSDDSDIDGLTQAEVDGLVFMREEEKLAHDVYVALYEQWDTAIFDNISQSETTHTNAVADLLNSYGIDDPAAGNDAGEFTDPALQAAYDQLVARGAGSLVAALEVGATSRRWTSWTCASERAPLPPSTRSTTGWNRAPATICGHS